MSLIKEYFELTKQYMEEYGDLTIILTQNGAFFEVYGLKDDNNTYKCKINDFSRICDLNIVDKKVPGGDMTINGIQVVNAGFKTHLIEKYIKKLQDNGFTIIVYEEVGDDPIKRCKIRDKTGIYSPGTYFYQESEQEQITNNICCLWIETKKLPLKHICKNNIFIGMAIIDIYTGNTYINEYNDEYIKNPTTFDELERFISIYNPSETIIVTNLQQTDITDLINFINLKSKSLHIVSLLETNKTNNKNNFRAINCEKQTYQTELLNKFYKINDLNTFMYLFYDNVYATQAFCFLLDFVYQHNPYLIQNISEPIFEHTNKRLILANHSLKQLNIIEDDNYKGKFSSVSKMLNECITPMGKRKFTNIFLNPVNDEDYLKKEYNIIESILINESNDFFAEDSCYKIVKNLLVQIKDISKIMRQIIIQNVTPKLIYQLYVSINISIKLYDFIMKQKYLHEYLNNKISDFVSLIDKSNKVINYLNDVFIIEECKDLDNITKIDKSFIKNGVDSDLDNNIQILLDSQDQLEVCRSYFNSLISTNILKTKKTSKRKKSNEYIEDDNEENEYVNIHETDKNKYSLLATDRRCKMIEDSINKNNSVTLSYNSTFSGLKTDFVLELELEFVKQSQTKKYITNNKINDICKNLSSTKSSLISTVTIVFQKIVKTLQNYQNDVESISDFITNIDIMYSKAYIAKKYNYCKPEIINNTSGKSCIRAIDLRHCLIEKIQQTELYVANNINIGDGTLTNNILDGILLYGTNAVGKTSFIRALGISVIMAQAGLYVPASSYQFKPYKYIFTRILGNDNIFKGLSTFAVEMSELRTILRLSDKNSLILGDELCSGTESISAVSIFVSGVQKLASINCSFIFATHLHEIITYDEITSLHNVGMKHMSVKYDKERDCLIYNRKLQDGPGNSMYGLEVCKSLNLPQDFLENAHNIRMKYHPEVGSILDHKGSHFNIKHITGGICEKCKIHPANDVHHLIYQNESDKHGFIKRKDISTFNKNDKANLINLCEKCHNEIHKTNKTYKKTQTTIGIILEEI